MAEAAIATPANARSRRTRRALLDAARAIVEEQGADTLTMAALAERAGVTRRTVYLHFPSRAEVVAALFAHVAEQEGLEDSLRRVWDAPDAPSALDEWARHLARYHTRVLAVSRAMARVEQGDEDAASHRAHAAQAKLRSCARLARRLGDEGVLATAWTVGTAADLLYALSTSDVVEGLTVDRGWANERFAERFAVLLRSTLLTPEARSEATS